MAGQFRGKSQCLNSLLQISFSGNLTVKYIFVLSSVERYLDLSSITLKKKQVIKYLAMSMLTSVY